ncbi:MAG: helix-turn-helix transcriptional regulator [Bryobacteraceae bacterium]
MNRSNAVTHLTAAEDAGQRLKRARERLNLRFRDVEEASARIAARRGNDEFLVALSRLADIENKGTVPPVFRLYSLCAIYRLDLGEVLSWYGVDLSELPADSAVLQHERTHMVGFHPQDGDVTVPLALDPGIDVSRTVFLSRLIQRWGTLPLMLLNNIDLKSKRYGLIGTEDWSMYPIVPPGSLVVIDDTKRRIATSGWKNEYERPIYFLEHRNGYTCGWCSLRDGQLMVQPHPASHCDPEAYAYPEEIEVIGQVTEIALSLGAAERRNSHSE